MTLGVFFTRGVSLRYWRDSGLLGREKHIYEYHLESGTVSEVIWFTYGARDDGVAAELHRNGTLSRGITVVGMPKWLDVPKLGPWLYSFLLPIIRRRAIRRCRILKTNQMDGSWAAVVAGAVHRKPVLVRTGYTITRFLRRIRPDLVGAMVIAERFAYRHATFATVTSRADRDYVVRRNPLIRDRVQIVPNYVDTDLFRPIGRSAERRLVAVGRLSSEKNLTTVLRAASRLGVGIDLYGEGPLRAELEATAGAGNIDARFLAPVPNSHIPDILGAHRVFMLASFFEGMPKALIEAMACGLVCVATDVSGNRELIVDGVNGFLAPGTDEDSIVTALERGLRADAAEIGNRARQTILDTYSLHAVADAERRVFVQLADQGRR